MVYLVGLVNLIVILFIVFLIYRKVKDKPLKNYFLPGLLIKFLAGIALGLIYKFYYGGGDTFNIFYDATILSDIAINSPVYYFKLIFTTDLPPGLADHFIYSNQDRALLAAKILSFFSLITRNNYWLSGFYWSLFSFCGMWYLANVLVKKYPTTRNAAVIGFLFFPSVIFWSSGILKESLIMGAMSFTIAFIIQSGFSLKRISYGKALLIILFLLLLWKLKYYYLAVLLPVVVAAFITLTALSKFKVLSKKSLILPLIWLLAFCLVLLISTNLYPSLKFNVILQYLVQTHNTIYNLSEPENLIHFFNLQPTLKSIITNLPLALFSGLYRPALWDANTLFQWFTAVENFFILLLSLFAIRNLRYLSNKEDAILLSSLIIYILILAAFMAFSSPNFGTLMRYKIGFLPFLVYLILIDNPFPFNVSKVSKEQHLEVFKL
jgi:hypothetical protein